MGIDDKAIEETIKQMRFSTLSSIILAYRDNPQV